jgi:hypothetical protein
VIPSLAKLLVILKKLQLFYYVVHYKARVDGKLALLWSALILLYGSHLASSSAVAFKLRAVARCWRLHQLLC